MALFGEDTQMVACSLPGKVMIQGFNFSLEKSTQATLATSQASMERTNISPLLQKMKETPRGLLTPLIPFIQ